MINVKYETISKGGKPVNEDVVYGSPNYWWILDGATGLNTKNLTTGKSDAQWYVKKWDEYLKLNLKDLERPLTQIVSDGIDRVKDAFYKECGLSNIEKIEKPSSTIALIRKVENRIEYFLLGDCTLLVKDTNGQVNRIKDNSIEKFDTAAINAMKKNIEIKGMSFQQARKDVNDILIKNRMLKNTYEGYWILEFEKEAVKHSVYGSIDIKELSSMLVMSDGYAAVCDLYKYFDEDELIYNIEKKGIEYIYNVIRKIEEEDYECKKYLRFKKGDDASAIFAKFERDI